MTMKMLTKQKLTLKDLIRHVVDSPPACRHTLIAALAPKFNCSARTVVRCLREGFRLHLLAAAKNGRLFVTKKGTAFILDQPPFFKRPLIASSIRGSDNRGLIGSLRRCRCGTSATRVPVENDCPSTRCMDMDTPLYKGVHCPQPARPALGRVKADGHESVIATLYHSFWPIVSKMPPLSNWPDRNRPFDYARSEVIQFVMHHCGIGLAMAIGIFYLAIDHGMVSFEAKSMTLAGVEGGHR